MVIRCVLHKTKPPKATDNHGEAQKITSPAIYVFV
jgi:hypothetical protein